MIGYGPWAGGRNTYGMACLGACVFCEGAWGRDVGCSRGLESGLTRVVAGTYRLVTAHAHQCPQGSSSAGRDGHVEREGGGRETQRLRRSMGVGANSGTHSDCDALSMHEWGEDFVRPRHSLALSLHLPLPPSLPPEHTQTQSRPTSLWGVAKLMSKADGQPSRYGARSMTGPCLIQ